MANDRSQQALAIMDQFAERTGVTGDRAPERYLWTDAFAVCNWLGLGRSEAALRLIDQVHHVLGRHRDDDSRSGWLSGLDERAGEAHPTRAGLRIGKKLPERAAGEPFDDRLEWDRDGQYFHYLTKWMHALDQAARRSRRGLFNDWARELAAAAHAAFTYDAPRGGRRMYWKMSVDLRRPLVPSMGHHDPLDGYITCVQLDTSASAIEDASGPDLAGAAADFAAMLPAELATADPLGLGGLLSDAHRVHQLAARGAAIEEGLLETLLGAAAAGLEHYARRNDLALPAAHRLAFRELGLAIGLATVPLLREELRGSVLDRLQRFEPLRGQIETFWLQPEHRRTSTWLDHANINDVMLATSLAPHGYLRLARGLD